MNDMGAIRGVLAVFIGGILLLSIFLAGLTFTLSHSLEYENVKLEISPIIKQIAEENLQLTKMIDNIQPIMELYCINNTEYVFSLDEYTFAFPCTVILQGGNATVDYGIEQLIETTYYKEYDCKFFDCFKEQTIPLFLISKSTKDFIYNKFIFVTLIAAALFVLLFLVVEKKANAVIISGAFIVISSLPFMKINDLLSGLVGDYAGIANIFLSNSFDTFLRMVIIGGVVLAAGILFKIFGISLKISEFLNRRKGVEKEKKKSEPAPEKKEKAKNKK